MVNHATIVSNKYESEVIHLHSGICVDCLDCSANGNDNHEEHCEGENCAVCIAFDTQGEDGWILVGTCPEDCEGWFATTPCDWCQRYLAGERHPAACLRVNRRNLIESIS